MPALQQIRKEKVLNHYTDAPFRALEYSHGFAGGEQNPEEAGGGNKIFTETNPEALKALLKQYQGRIKCIWQTASQQQKECIS